MPLFDDIARHDSSYATHGEDSFTFLNRVEGPMWQRVRGVLEAWFADYPNEHASALRGNFRSNRPGQHIAAYWELYLHHLFRCLGYRVLVHTEVPDSDHRPDFELTRQGERLYVEAAVVFSGIVDEGRDGVREGWIMDAVNRATSPNFFVSIEFEQLGERRPKDRDVYQPLERWLATLDPDQVAAHYEAAGRFPTRLIEVGDWRLRFEAFPIKPEARGKKSHRVLGHGPVISGFVDDTPQLRDTLKHKRGRYGSTDAPLVVAVNFASSHPDDEDIADALYGSTGYQYKVDVPGSGKSVRLRDGTWMSDRGPRGQRMSAVLTAVQLHPWTVVTTVPRLWHNPWAHIPLTLDWPFPGRECTEEGRVTGDERNPDMGSILGLPPDWPGPKHLPVVSAA